MNDDNVEPKNDVELNKRLMDWINLAEQLKTLRAKESALRAHLFGRFFPAPKEGTNTTDLHGNHKLKGKLQYNYNLDAAVLDIVSKSEEYKHIDWGKVIRWKPELVKSEYNKLSQGDQNIVSQALVITPGSKSLEFIEPKKK